MSGHQPRHVRRQRLHGAITATAVVLGIAGVVAWGLAADTGEVSPPTPPAPEKNSASSERDPGDAEPSRPDPGDGGSGRADGAGGTEPAQLRELDWSAPVSVAIPSLEVSSSLEELGLDPTGAMTTPADPDRAGWFTPGPAPGVIGAAVIAGHVTWDKKPAVFFDVGRMAAGDRIRVERKDGVTAIFEVTRVGQFAKDKFPTQAVYGQTDRAALRLITCGGEYDDDANRYTDNVIVWAELVASVKA